MTTVYIAWDAEGVPLYVGCTDDLERRMRQHSGKWWGRATALLTQQVFDSRDEALAVERDLIWALRPKANVIHNWRPDLEFQFHPPTARERKVRALQALADLRSEAVA